MSSPLCILLIDDSVFFLTLEREFLCNTPATILTAQTAGEGMAIAREYRPNIIYTAIDLPETNGAEFCRMVKDDFLLSKTPVILIGDRNRPEHDSLMRNTSADATIQKPLNRREFLEVGHMFLPGIERREPRKSFRLAVTFVCQGSEQVGQCIDISSGGMFLTSPPVAGKGERLLLEFRLPGLDQQRIKIVGRIAWANIPGQEIKEDYPPGYGVEFIEIPDDAGIALRRFFSAQ